MGFRAAYRVFGRGLALLAGVCLLSGCELAFQAVSERPPLLLEVDDVGPPTIEADTPILVSGSGFPERKEGELALHGEVFVPGREPKEVHVALSAVSDSRSKVHATLSEAELLRLVQGARHATFVGSATLQFESPGSSTPLVGEASEVVLDLYSMASSAQSSADSASFSTYLGMNVTPDLRVGSIESGGIAEQSGVMLGDQLKRLDGVRLDSLDDLLPRARAKVSRLTVLRAGEELLELSVPRASFEPGLLAVATKVLSWVACLVVAILLGVRLPRSFARMSWVKRRSKAAPDAGSSAVHVALAVVIVLLWSSLLRPTSVFARVDLLVLLGVGVAFDLGSAFVLGGRTTKHFSLWNGLTRVVSRLPQLTPLVFALLVGSLETGSLASADLARRSTEEGFAIGALQSPWMLVLALLALVSLIPGPRVFQRPDPAAIRYASAVSLAAKSAVWATLFLWETHGTGKWSSILLSLKISLTVIFAQMLARKVATLGLRSQRGLFPAWAFWASLSCLLLGVVVPRMKLFAGVTGELSQLSVWLLASLVAVALVAWARGDHERGRTLDPWV